MPARPGGAPVTAPRVRWCVLVVVWSLVFAAPHFSWAMGGRTGLGAQAADADAALEQGWFALYNLAAGCLGIAGAVVAVVLAANRGRERVQRWLLLAAAVASVLLLLRGALGVTLLGAGLLSGSHDEQTPWLLLAIEPWFVLGGLAFGGLALSQRRQTGAHRLARAAS